MDDGSGLPSDPEQLQAVIEEVEAKVISLQGSIAEEEAKMEGYRVGLLGVMSWPEPHFLDSPLVETKWSLENATVVEDLTLK